MIYCLNPKFFPLNENANRVLKELDLNEQEWRISSIDRGVFLSYNGDSYFKESRIVFDDPYNEYRQLQINNTNCIVFKDVDFDLLGGIINLVKTNFTDDIWEELGTFFKARFSVDGSKLDSEIVRVF